MGYLLVLSIFELISNKMGIYKFKQTTL